MRLGGYCLNISMETIFMNIEKRKTSESYNIRSQLVAKIRFNKFDLWLDLRFKNKHVALQNLSIYYT